MKVLLVEDDADKRGKLITFIKEKIECNLTEARSFQSALKAIKQDLFDLILLDMTMPTFDITPNESGGRVQPFGGVMILQEMQRYEIKTKVIVVTQFDLFGKDDEVITLKDLDLRIMEQFKDIYLGAVQYSETYAGWRENLYDKIMKFND